MIKSIDIFSILRDKYSINKNTSDYSILIKKFSNRFSLEYVNELLDSVNNQYVNIFVNTMNLNNKQQYMENFYSNLSNSKIVKSKILQKVLLNKGSTGLTVLKKRAYLIILGTKKELEKNNASLTPYHELLHLMTTRIVKEDDVRIGFQQNDFGCGLNEGYTELLTERYFDKYSYNDSKTYIHFTWFASMLEEIFGKEKIEDLYFTSNIEGLMIELQKYLTMDKVINFIEDIDLLLDSENELEDYQADFICDKKKFDDEELNNYYSSNKELFDRIYNTFLQINEKKEKILGIKTDFKEKNDKIKHDYDVDEEIYKDYFKNECKLYVKK